MMSPEFYRRLLLPFAIFFLGCYLIGFRVYQNRYAEPVVPKTVVEENQRKLAEGEKINLNGAAKEELMRVDGLGETLATRIIEYRESLGGFKTIEQIKDVNGIGEKLFEVIKNYLAIE